MTEINNNDLEKHLFEILSKRIVSIDVAHDTSHLKRVLNMARKISQVEGKGNPLVITAAALLHDYIALPKNDPERNMASRLSSHEAKKILIACNFPEYLLKDTMNAIEAHSFSANIPTNCIEAEIIQDADRIDALGAIGIARCFAVSGSIGRLLFNPDDTLGDEGRELDSSTWGLDYFMKYLVNYPQTMKTTTGKKIAEERVQYFYSFADRLKAETNAQV
jgi:uncharacterized protein